MRIDSAVALGIAASGLLLSGCAYRQHVTRMAVDYNQFVADATNRQTVLNILRARDREPLHFTSFTKVDGTVTGEAMGSFDPGLKFPDVERTPGAGGAFETSKRTFTGATLAPTLGATITSGTDFEIAINSTDDFWKGILGPLQPSVVAYYLRSGWNAELLSYLFVDRIDFSITVAPKRSGAGKPGQPPSAGDGLVDETVVTLRNDPDKKEDMERFQAGARCRTIGVEVSPPSEQRIPIASLQDLANVSADVLAKIEHRSDKDATTLDKVAAAGEESRPLTWKSSEPESFGITLEPSDGSGCTEITNLVSEAILKAVATTEARRANAVQKLDETSRNQLALAVGGLRLEQLVGGRVKSEGFCDQLVDARYRCNLQVAVTFRSIEGVIYYLGVLQRSGDGKLRPLLKGPSCPTTLPYCIPIIRVALDPNIGVNGNVADVEYKGVRYYVPSSGQTIDSESGRSSEVLTLVEQLLNLYRSSKDFPSTPSVRVVR